MVTLYDFHANTLAGECIDLKQLKNQVVLVVNTASQCGYTKQYQGLQRLFGAYHKKGLSILAFPCNQFGQQEPGDGESIQNFCETQYGVTFPIMEKVDVKTHPLWRWLTQADTHYAEAIEWNFTKFLIDHRGHIVRRYKPSVTPHEMVADVTALLRVRNR